MLYEQLFGPWNCSYSVHVIAAHLLKIRDSGPLTSTSAFPFEHFYGEMRKTYVLGTQSITKQIFSKILLKRTLAFHSCLLPIHLSEKDTKMECNSLVYEYQNKQHKMYKIISVNGNVLTCHPQGYFKVSFPETPELNWSEIGVFKLGGISEAIKHVHKCQISGKVIMVSNLLITCPINILRESYIFAFG